MNNNSKLKIKFKLFPKGNCLKLLWVLNFAVTIVFMGLMILVNAFPPELSMYILIALACILLVTQILLCVRTVSRAPNITGIILSIIYIVVFCVGSYYLYSTFSVFSRIGAGEEEITSGIDVTKDAYNVYLTGIDQWDSEKNEDLERSDVNMIATVNPITKTILLTSIPRDAYVPLAKNGEMDKLTHTGIYGVDETVTTAEKWLGLDINYYVKVNFSGVVGVINAIGGIEVYSPESFVPEKARWYKVKKGWNHMSGKEALGFARERHQLKNGDGDRVLNQQRVIKGIIRKLTSSPAILTSYTKLLKVVDKSVTTSFKVSEMTALARAELMELGGWKIETQALKGHDELRNVYSLSSAHEYYVTVIDEKSIDKSLKKIDEVLNPDEEYVAELLEKRYKDQQKNMLKNFVESIKFWKK